MRVIHRTIEKQPSAQPRAGVTLSEVLMSVMIMGIGVVSLATLFPISSLRVLEATNLTNSTVARFNAEGVIDSFPQMVHNPDGISTTREGGMNYIVDPLGWYELSSQTGTNHILYEHYDFSTNTSYRPLSVSQPPLTQQTRYLGDNVSSPSLFSDIDVARQAASLQDTTTDFGEGFPTAYVPTAPSSTTPITGVELSVDEVDLSVFDPTNTAYQDPTGYQVVIFDVTGRYSEIRPISSVSGQTVNWASALPARYSPIVGLVRIERVEPFYSWMLTVRKRASGPANVDVVVFSKRDFSELSEQVYVGEMRRFNLGADGVPGTAGVDLNNDTVNNDVGEIGYPGSDDQQNNRVTVDWTASLYPPAPSGWIGDWPEKPPLRRGGFVFDTANALWYRILSIEEAPTATSAIIALEKAISRNNTEDLIENNSIDTGEDRNNDGVLDRGGLIIPRGVVAVFPLETKLQQ